MLRIFWATLESSWRADAIGVANSVRWQAAIVALLLSDFCVLRPVALSSEQARIASNIDSATVTMTVTPGKPGAPTETISIHLAKSDPVLEVKRFHQEGDAVQSESRGITPDEFQTVWTVIEQEKLRAWLPEEEDGEVFDFGERRLRVEWSAVASSKPQVHEVAWTRPLKSQDQLRRLQEELSKLVHRHIRTVSLYYFH